MISSRAVRFTVLLIIAVLMPVIASCSSKLQSVNADKDGNAIKGYDPVSYFTDGRPVKGDSRYAYTWKNTRWLFASEGHLNLFRENPEKYAPAYGGY